MADETNPRSLEFQINHVADLYGKLPRHNPEDLQSINDALASLRSINLNKVRYFLPGTNGIEGDIDERRRLKQILQELDDFLPTWANNLSDNYFVHARTLPVTIGVGE